MRVSFDIDGVLADFSSAAVKAIRALYLPDMPADYEHKTWSFTDILKPFQFDDVFNFLMQQDNFWTHLQPFQENIIPLKEYVEVHGSKDVYFLTARPDGRGGSAKIMTSLWLHDQGLPFHNIIIAPSHGDKAAILAEHGIAYHLDDYAPTIRDCQGLAGVRAYVLDRPYNQDATDLPRVYSVAEYLVEVELG